MLRMDYMALLRNASKAGLEWPSEDLTGLAPHLGILEYAFHELAHAVQVLHFVISVDLRDLTRIIEERTQALEPSVAHKQEALALRAVELLFVYEGAEPSEVKLLEDSNRIAAEVQDTGMQNNAGERPVGRAYESTTQGEAEPVAAAVREVLQQWGVLLR